MIWKQRFPHALSQYLRDVHGVEAYDEATIFARVKELDNQRRRGIWAAISEILDILPQDAHDYFHNTWTKQFFDPIDEVKTQLAELVVRYVDAAESKKDLVELCLERIAELYPNKSFHMMSMKEYLYHQINKTSKFGSRRRGKSTPTSEESDERHIMELVTLFLKGNT